MPKQKPKNIKKYKVPKERFRELYYFSLQYPEWKRQLAEVTVIGSPNMDGMPHGSCVGNPTERIGTTNADLLQKINLVEGCAKESDPEIWKSVLKAVTTENCTYNWLVWNKMLYCGRDKFYQARRMYYWLLSQRKG